MKSLTQIQREGESQSHALCGVGADAILALLSLGSSNEARQQLDNYFGSREAALALLQNLAKPMAGIQCKTFVLLDEAANPPPTYLGLVETLTTIARLPLRQQPKTSADKINAMIHEQCGFSEVLKEEDLLLDPFAVLLNLLVFQGAWETPFQKHFTGARKFTRLDGSTTEVQMMVQEEVLEVFSSNGVQIVRLGFDNNSYAEFAMGLDPAEAFPSAELKFQNCLLRLPRFKHDRLDVDLKQLVTKAGCGAIFQRGNLTEMGPAELFVSLFKQVLSVSFDEEGAEVKAATVAVCSLESACVREKPIKITFDKPFRYRIMSADDLEIVQGVYNGD